MWAAVPQLLAMDTCTETCAHGPFSSETVCKAYFNIHSEASSSEVGCEEAMENQLEAGKILCAGSYTRETHCYSSLRTSMSAERPLRNGTEGFYAVGNAEESCRSGSIPVCEASDGSIQAWVSPRVSFSRNFAMTDIDMAIPNNTQSSSSRLSPEKRKWDQQDDGSVDFEFLHYVPTYKGTEEPAEGFMLSADELFSNGKLLPVSFCNNLGPRDDFFLPSSTSELHLHESVKLSINKSSASRPIARHLSFELPKPHCSTSHVTSSCTSSPSRAREAGFSSCAAPALQSLTPTSASKLPSLVSASALTTLSSPSSKYSAKIKEIFKLKKVLADPLPSELSRDNSFTSTCRLPISPRSFWPFARSSSTCDNTSSPVHRRISEIKAASIPSQNVDGGKYADPCRSAMNETLKIEGLLASTSEKTSSLSQAASTGDTSNAETLPESQRHSHPSLNNIVEAVEERNASMVASKLRESLSPPEISKKKASATSSLARGSPGRRGGTKKLNTGKIILRNLERCSAEKRAERDAHVWKGRSTYCSATRVSPVLNVAIYRGGNASKNGFFNFGSLFSTRKNKKPMEPTAINWRKGA